MNLELALWQWSNLAQVSSLLIITVFFTVLRRSVRQIEMRWWVYAWSADFAALAVTLAFWYVNSSPDRLQEAARFLPAVRVLYLATKTAFLLFLLRGTWTLRGRSLWFVRQAPMTTILVGVSIAGLSVVTSVDRIGIFETVAIILLLGGASVAIAGEGGLTWLSIGFASRAFLAMLECVGYAMNLAPDWQPLNLRAHLGTFLAVHSSFDTAAEWLIALGCVIATLDRTQRRLQTSNTELLSVQEDLRRLVDRDPLTSLSNRRALPEVFRTVQPHGATLVFFDLNGFKRINDEHGHQVGDACLKRFAAALLESFRPQDAVVRYAGDEFLVVASGLTASSVHERIDILRTRLRPESRTEVAISFSFGISELAAGGQPDAALRAADEAMYRVKPVAQIA